MNKILVTGATGNLGHEVINVLLQKTNPANIVALVRDPQNEKALSLKAKGVEIRKGDYNDFSSLVNAFKGIDKLYFISSNDLGDRSPQHKNVVNAAKETSIKHVVYTSFQRRNSTETSPIALIALAHVKTEQWLKEAGLTYTILKHNMYLDMLPMFLGEQLLETGVAYLPAGDGKVAFTLRTDMAELGAVVLTTAGHENKTYNVSNTTATSIGEIASIISNISGKQITYVSPSHEKYTKTLVDAGVPAEFVALFASLAEGFKEGEFDETSKEIETLIGREPISVAQFLQQVYGAKN